MSHDAVRVHSTMRVLASPKFLPPTCVDDRRRVSAVSCANVRVSRRYSDDLYGHLFRDFTRHASLSKFFVRNCRYHSDDLVVSCCDAVCIYVNICTRWRNIIFSFFFFSLRVFTRDIGRLRRLSLRIIETHRSLHARRSDVYNSREIRYVL